MNKNTSIIVAIIIITLGIGLAWYYYRNNTGVTVTPNTNNTSVVYTNTQYGFTFDLPDNWKGYSVVENTWTGTALTRTVAPSGPKISIRNPKWTASAPYEDLPVLVFTLSQWNAYGAEEFSVSAAPIQASELARNNMYVFALPPRWDFDYSLEYTQAKDIFKGNPLHTFTIENTTMSQGKLNINVICDQALAYMTFSNAKNAEIFVADCKEGKHPEVIEKYKADLNLGAGAAI